MRPRHFWLFRELGFDPLSSLQLAFAARGLSLLETYETMLKVERK